MGQARINVSEQLLRQALHMPDDVTILNVRLTWPHRIDLLLESPELPDVPEGNDPPMLNPNVTRIERYEWDWGDEEAIEDDANP